ncbi:MAG: class I SAM-dependent methyltransferase, partial [Candidatus Levybacteria bacterium]|nr:class I SAM-dependent methyltransferase [Candidatus Levybacteria bacterium]
MELLEYKNIYDNEEKHFFYRANHALFLSFIKDLKAKNVNALKILDAGCGTGLLAKKLGKFGDVAGVDISPQALFYAKKRGIRVKQASVN